MTAQHGGQVLSVEELTGEKAALTKHQGKEPHHPGPRWLVGEVDFELPNVDLCLFARRRIETVLEAPIQP